MIRNSTRNNKQRSVVRFRKVTDFLEKWNRSNISKHLKATVSFETCLANWVSNVETISEPSEKSCTIRNGKLQSDYGENGEELIMELRVPTLWILVMNINLINNYTSNVHPVLRKQNWFQMRKLETDCIEISCTGTSWHTKCRKGRTFTKEWSRFGRRSEIKD